MSRYYQLRTEYLAACAQGRAESWSPRLSGGDHHPDWPVEAVALAAKLLASKPPCSYSAVASELLRRLNFKTNRASVRRWAFANQLAPDTRYKAPRQPVKRWQARDYGALWQYDASPHAWLPGSTDKQALLDILDDATRLNTGARLYHHETLLAHLDFLSRVFQTHGLPLALYVDWGKGHKGRMGRKGRNVRGGIWLVVVHGFLRTFWHRGWTLAVQVRCVHE